MRAILLVFYGAGLRRGEALRLTAADVDLPNSLLTIRYTKFFKSRLVPIGQDLTKVLSDYAVWRSAKYPAAGANNNFFVGEDGEALPPITLGRAFQRLRKYAGIRRTDTTRFQPRMHDLRHTFAVHRLTEWYRQGAGAQRLVYHLSVYLGHVSLVSTQVYLTMTPELLREASTRLSGTPSGRTFMRDPSLLGPWIRRFLMEHMVSERNLARNTQRSYRDAFRLVLPAIARRARKPIDRLAVTDLSADRVRQFLMELEEKRRCAIVTRNQGLAAIHALASFIALHAPELVEWCGQVRTVPFKKAPRTLVTYLEKPEMDALLEAPDTTTAQPTEIRPDPCARLRRRNGHENCCAVSVCGGTIIGMGVDHHLGLEGYLCKIA